MKIAIVGCGTAGPAAAIFLANDGHEVTLFDKAPQCLPVGAGFMLQPSGMKVLHELKILEPIVQLGSKIHELHAFDERGTLMHLKYNEWKKESFGLGLHRPVLLRFLLEKMLEANVKIHWACEILHAERKNQKWILTDAEKNTHGEFDFLIIADGARSHLRNGVCQHIHEAAYPWGAHWFIGKITKEFSSNTLHQVVRGTKILTGFLPTGKDDAGDDELLSIFCSIKLEYDESIRKKSLTEWKAEILSYEPHAENFLSQITDWSQILTARYGDVRMKSSTGDHAIVLGDAAHAMSPQLGQGVNLALSDASVLAQCLREFDVPCALENYKRRRFMALTYYQHATRWLTPFFQSDYEFLEILRSLIIRSSMKIPLSKKIMTATLAGVIGEKSLL